MRSCIFDTRQKSVRPRNYVQQRVPPPRHAHTNLNHRHQPTDTIPGMHNTLLVLRLHGIYTCASQRRSDHLERIYNAYRGAGSSRAHWHPFSETSRTPPRPSSQHIRSKHRVKKKYGSVTCPPPPPPKSNEAARAQETLAPLHSNPHAVKAIGVSRNRRFVFATLGGCRRAIAVAALLRPRPSPLIEKDVRRGGNELGLALHERDTIV